MHLSAIRNKMWNEENAHVAYNQECVDLIYYRRKWCVQRLILILDELN